MKVIIADDHRQVRVMLVRLLDGQEDMDVVGEAENGSVALERIEALEPDVVLLDVNMPVMSGLQVLGALQDGTRPKVVMLSMYSERSLIENAVAAGAAGYVSKRSGPAEILAAVRAVAAGGTYFCGVARAALTAE